VGEEEAELELGGNVTAGFCADVGVWEVSVVRLVSIFLFSSEFE